jgi:hypothetical protein
MAKKPVDLRSPTCLEEITAAMKNGSVDAARKTPREELELAVSGGNKQAASALWDA